MTPERQKWWDSLPTNERKLRVALDANRRMLRLAKKYLTEFKGSVCHAGAVRKQKLIIKALKHELDRTTVAVYVGRLKEGVSIYRCKKCGGMFKNFEQTHCCWCGRKIKGCKSNE